MTKVTNYKNPSTYTSKYSYGISHKSYRPDIHRGLQHQSDFWLPKHRNVSNITEASKLVSYQRGISNFVNILTGRSNIKVKFNGDRSYTDGESITIGADIAKPDKFDPACGLALHEASHIKLSDFGILNQLRYNTGVVANYKYTETQREVLKGIINIIEDRRIDYFVYTTCPGYAGYYQAMYNLYFNNGTINKALKAKTFKDSTKYESYMFYLTNMTNPNIDLDSLPGLREMIELIDLDNIGRLNNTDDSFKLAIEVFELINQYVSEPDPDMNGSGSTGDGDGDTGEDATDKDNDSDGDNDSDSTGFGDDTDDNSDGDADAQDGNSDSPGHNEITPALQKAIDKQRNFLDSAVKKSKINKQTLSDVNNIVDSKIELKDVPFSDDYGDVKTINTIIINKFTEGTCNSDSYKAAFGGDYAWQSLRNQDYINSGLALGTKLGNKLQVRNDETTIINNRKLSGRIDKRMLHSFGYGNDAAFMVKQLIKYPAATLHISIDASASMYGRKWENAQKTAVAIAKAASMISNFDVVISYRSITNSKPVILIAYDSTKDSISKIKKLFCRINPDGEGTPEGLCFASISNMLKATNNDKEQYFINISDGEPGYRTAGVQYTGQPALAHTKKQVDEIRNSGVKVLSYLVTSNNYMKPDNFKAMYGPDAVMIDTNQLAPLAKSLNDKFIKK